MILLVSNKEKMEVKMRNSNHHTQQKSAPDKSMVLAKALRNSIDFWDMKQQELGRILGKKQATISNILNGKQPLLPESKEGELALLFLRAFRSLDTLMGTHRRNQINWLTHHHKTLNGKPLELMIKPEGLVQVVNYLDAMRGKA